MIFVTERQPIPILPFLPLFIYLFLFLEGVQFLVLFLFMCIKNKVQETLFNVILIFRQGNRDINFFYL